MSEQHFPTPRPVQMEATFAAGEIEVSTTESDQSTVRLDGPENLVEPTRVELVGDRLVIQQRRKSLFSFLGYSHEPLRILVQVPPQSTLKITTAAGEVRLDGSFGGLELRSASGGVSARGELNGDATVKNVSGDVRLPRVAGELIVRTVSGDVHAASVGGSVSAQSVSGAVHVGSLHEGRVNVQSVSGDVELGIASGTSVDVDAGSASGQLSSEVPLSDAPGREPGPVVVIRGNTVSGDFRVVRAA